jgi:biotin operon repressor
MVKKTFSIPDSLYDDLAYVARRMGVSRSAILVDFMEQSMSDMRLLLSSIPENPNEQDILRSRGVSRDVIAHRLKELRDMEDGYDLFAK